MSSSRPVPRRESPWGLPEGDTRQPQAHRCNDRAEDVIQVILLFYSFFLSFPPPIFARRIGYCILDASYILVLAV